MISINLLDDVIHTLDNKTYSIVMRVLRYVYNGPLYKNVTSNTLTLIHYGLLTDKLSFFVAANLKNCAYVDADFEIPSEPAYHLPPMDF